MKFGTQLKTHWASHWKYHYVDYDGLKGQLKSKSLEKEFSKQDEDEFTKSINSELEKVASFQALKLGEIQRRIEHCEHTIEQHQLPSGKSSERLTLASFVETESEINKITQDLQDLARFQRLNYTAFLKIIKKHDKHTGFTLRAYFMNHQLNNHPFHRENFSNLVSRLSSLFNIVRTGTAPTISKAESITSEDGESLEHSGCIPKKSAFWVHPDCLMDLKMLILKYLPLVVYEPTPALNSSHRSTNQLNTYLTSSSPVSTIYLDNPSFDLYMSQIEQHEESETVRLRWYGSENKHMWVEHQKATIFPNAAASSSTSVPVLDEPIITKHRFQIKSKYIPKLVQGSAKIDKVVEQMRRSGQKTEQEIQLFEESTRIVQSRIKEGGLQPVTQTFFNRTAFQVPGDGRVRITIDSDVVMVREKPIIPSELYERPWDPIDLQAEDYPFTQIPDKDIVRFPYAIMQIRTLTEPQEEIPSWVDNIAQSHLVEMVPNFTKDLHAVATLYESRVGLLPFWLSDMDRDIRKPAALTGGFPRRSTLQDSVSSNSGSNDTLNSGRSTSATSVSISEEGTPSSSQSTSVLSSNKSKKKPRSRRSILDSNEIYTPNVTFREEVQDLESLNREVGPRMKKPVVSCLKKSGSYSSRNSSNEDLASPKGITFGGVSEDYGSTASESSGRRLRRSKRATIKKSAARKWLDKVTGWVPFIKTDFFKGSNDDLEAQYQYSYNAYHGSERQRTSHVRKTITKLFWTGISVVNVALLFVGLVLALMNLGDSVGHEAASLFLVVSCLCMGTTVWTHLSRMDGQNDYEEEVGFYNYNKPNEHTGLLSPREAHSSQCTHAAHRGRWIRTRLMPVIMFLSLGTVVVLNSVVRMYPFEEEVGTV
ncbi:vacuolar transporter chaperone [Mortierella sp. AD011]|nr:vacuolar transporter chaperone [Mortierella sp. AD010]KAF9401565.1 vacuolar transporter chaperone [Mortierella sp. AD011]